MINQEQADQVIDFISGMLRPPDPELTRTAWRSSLAPLDPDVASQAAINGCQVWKFWPDWPSYMLEYTAVEMRRGESSHRVEVLCRSCLDMGWVLAYMRPGGFEEYGPCPDCEVGKGLEGRLYPRGFWQGRDATWPRPLGDLEPSDGEPEWVTRWRKARANKDMRPFPEQAGVLGHGQRPSTPVDDKEAWVQQEEYGYGGEGHA